MPTDTGHRSRRPVGPEFCSIEEWLGFEINTLDYYRALRETNGGSYQPERGTHGWLRFCLRAHHIQAQVVERQLQYGQQIWAAMVEIVKQKGFDERVVAALYAAAMDQLRREVYQREEGLTRDKAIRDIRRLEHAGLVEAVGYGASLYYVADGEAKEAIAEIATSLTAPTREPYEDV